LCRKRKKRRRRRKRRWKEEQAVRLQSRLLFLPLFIVCLFIVCFILLGILHSLLPLGGICS